MVAGLPGATFEAAAEFVPRRFSNEQIRSARDGRLSQAGPFSDTHTMFSFGAQFAEVRVIP